MRDILIGDYSVLVKIAVTAPVLYFILILYIRIFGKRTTSQMNSFDWVVTVAMGSIFASTVVLKGVSILAGAFAILVLILMQYVLTRYIVSSKTIRKIVKTTPQLLLFEGKFIEENMKNERVTKPEVYAAIRKAGLPNINEVYAIVLETDANFSIIGMEESNTSFSLADVEGLPDGLKKDLKKVKESGEFPSG